MKGNKLLAAAGVLAGVYGIGIGLAAKAKQPRNMEEARGQGSLSGLGSQMVKDAVITFGDDAIAIAALPLLKRRFKSMGGIFDTAMGALAIGGAGIGGTIAGHDFQNYVAARQYRGRGGDLDLSQNLVPDSRINPISGFNNAGMVGQNRKQQTGIGSPAAGGIFYNMWHNPFADMLNQSIAAPNPNSTEDPRAKALGFAMVGHIIGGSLGASKGLGRATMLGLVGGIAGGAYGMYSAHNPDLQANAGALGQIALGVLPSVAAGGLLYGLSHGKLGKFGAAVRSGLNKTTGAIGYSSKYVEGGARLIGQGQVGLTRASLRTHGPIATFTKHDAFTNASKFLTGRMGRPVDLGLMVQKTLSGATHGTAAAGNFVLGGARHIASATAGVMDETGKHSGHWDQALGVGHLITFIPHQIAIAAAADSIYNSSQTRGKHSSNVVASNNAQKMHGRFHSSDGDFGFTKNSSGKITPQLY